MLNYMHKWSILSSNGQIERKVITKSRPEILFQARPNFHFFSRITLIKHRYEDVTCSTPSRNMLVRCTLALYLRAQVIQVHLGRG